MYGFATAPTLAAGSAPSRALAPTLMSASGAPLPAAVEAYAGARARLDAGVALADVLAWKRLSEAAWRALEADVVGALQEEARAGQASLGRRYAVAYAEEWDRHAPRFSPKPASRPSPPPPPTTRRPKNGTIAMSAAAPAMPAMPAAIGGTVVMEVGQESEGSTVNEEELRRYVDVSAALASSIDRDGVLRRHGLALTQWVEWSGRVVRSISNDPALRARYSELLHAALAR